MLNLNFLLCSVPDIHHPLNIRTLYLTKPFRHDNIPKFYLLVSDEDLPVFSLHLPTLFLSSDNFRVPQILTS